MARELGGAGTGIVPPPVALAPPKRCARKTENYEFGPEERTHDLVTGRAVGVNADVD